MFKKIVLLAVVFALVGCVPLPSNTPQVQPMSAPYTIIEDGQIHRYYDAEAGVVCWWFAYDGGYNGEGGLSCLPISDTNLTPEQLGGV